MKERDYSPYRNKTKKKNVNNISKNYAKYNNFLVTQGSAC